MWGAVYCAFCIDRLHRRRFPLLRSDEEARDKTTPAKLGLPALGHNRLDC